MAASRMSSLLLFIFMFLRLTLSVDPLFDELLSGIEKAVSYYQTSYKEMNLDGIFGLRVVEGQIALLIDEIDDQKLKIQNKKVLERLRKIKADATYASKEAIPYLEKGDGEYYRSMKYLVGEQWSIFHRHRKLDPNLKWVKSDLERIKEERKKQNISIKTIDEERSDKCMKELFGSDTQKPCQVSDECMYMITAKGLKDYLLTHQLLFTLLGEKVGCISKINEWLHAHGEPRGINQLQLEFCTNNYYEVKESIELMKGKIWPIQQDIFLEEEFVCPSMGFIQFLRRDWLQQILTWQKPNGCFGKMKRAEMRDSIDGLAIDESSYVYENEAAIDMIEYLKKQKKQRQQNGDSNERSKSEEFDKIQGNLIQPNSQADSLGSERDSQMQVQFQQPAGVMNKSILNQPLQKQVQWNQLNQQTHLSNRLVYQNKEQALFQPPNEKYITHIPAQQQQIPKNRQQLFQENQMQHQLNIENHQENAHLPSNPLMGARRLMQYNVKSYRSRRLLVEKDLAGGCLSHKTAVGTAAMVMYLRFMLDPGPPELQEYHRALIGDEPAHSSHTTTVPGEMFQKTKSTKNLDDADMDIFHNKMDDDDHHQKGVHPKHEIREVLRGKGQDYLIDGDQDNPHDHFDRDEDNIDEGENNDREEEDDGKFDQNDFIAEEPDQQYHLGRKVNPLKSHHNEDDIFDDKNLDPLDEGLASSKKTTHLAHEMQGSLALPWRNLYIVMVVAAVMLFFMFRFIKKRRISIRYRHR
ncbi:uncharacterized protein LOC106160335 isoform X1 [Lingula anatina]|uniref:Uncharacterized protein LOC106160335 isoform X1 n=1 Tax=Lingula anatina TaxID=7574 RepID=A0A1S3I4R7_LINAN|nr:uncharacterized protein LOC106160335 isoform X1 [Lingula anatina]|eukprot:XP_013392359.1 uncharacterized protein LOC106160335 isoform X1 [Lingula anatina]